jgi:hypothetical protein
MFNRTLNRPMFRRGGRAGGGIMTGVQRQGYAGEDDKQIVEKNDMEKVAGNMESFNKAFPQYPYAASDFFMNLGSNILATTWWSTYTSNNRHSCRSCVTKLTKN